MGCMWQPQPTCTPQATRKPASDTVKAWLKKASTKSGDDFRNRFSRCGVFDHENCSHVAKDGHKVISDSFWVGQHGWLSRWLANKVRTTPDQQ